jgi:hypothetical protein
VPERTVNRTAGDPAQTSVSAFQSTGAEPFVAALHWSSTEDSSTDAWLLSFNVGTQVFTLSKDFFDRVRAFRKLAL